MQLQHIDVVLTSKVRPASVLVDNVAALLVEVDLAPAIADLGDGAQGSRHFCQLRGAVLQGAASPAPFPLWALTGFMPPRPAQVTLAIEPLSFGLALALAAS